VKTNQEVRRTDADGLLLFDPQLSTLDCLTRIRRNKARMSMKTKDKDRKSWAGGDPALERLRCAEGAVRSDCTSSPDLSLRDIADPTSRVCGSLIAALRVDNRRNKARMSMKTKDWRKNQPSLTPLDARRGTADSPLRTRRGGWWCGLAAFVWFAPWRETGIAVEKRKDGAA